MQRCTAQGGGCPNGTGKTMGFTRVRMQICKPFGTVALENRLPATEKKAEKRKKNPGKPSMKSKCFSLPHKMVPIRIVV